MITEFSDPFLCIISISKNLAYVTFARLTLKFRTFAMFVIGSLSFKSLFRIECEETWTIVTYAVLNSTKASQ
jgi:hypothetical protein